MPKTVEMVVSLKVPDTTAITALQTLQKIGFASIKDVKRSDYYKFLVEGDAEKFKDKICKVDILVNANKHHYEFSINKNNNIKVLVKNTDDDGSLLSTLKSRLGLKNIKRAEKGVLWALSIEGSEKDAEKTAKKAAEELLTNPHYQEYSFIN